MARIRTQKAVSRRVDLNYFKRPHALRTGRQLLFFVAGALTIVLVTFLSLGGDARLHNPGSLTSAHAAWQHDCRACHDGGAAGTAGAQSGFAKTVSDAACLSCHDGAIHHHNQKPDTVNKWPALAGTADAKLTSKDCVSCHVEHRGEAALAASHSSLCIDCHGNLRNNAAEPAKIQVASLVTGFAELQHPPFGRSLVKPGSTEKGSAAWFDPTVLKFNHAKHNNIAVLKDNCISCHSTNDPQIKTNPPSPTNPPPYTSDKDRPLDWSRSQDLAYIQPISYARHCVGCHAIELPGKVRLTVPHEDMTVVRGFLAGIANQYALKLAALPDKSAELKTVVVTGRPPRQRREEKIITESEWVNLQLAALVESADKSFGRDPTYASIKKALTPPTPPPAAAPTTTTATTAPAAAPAQAAAAAPVADVSLLEHFVSYGIGSNCNYCHEMQGQVPALVYAKPPPGTTPSATPATAPTPNLQLAFTTPTGIPDSPRRWFKNSHFDHNAHRSVSCLDCHSKALTSADTAQVLSPDMTEGAASCVSCHKADSPSLMRGPVRGAPADCITCHNFHDPLQDRPPTGTFNPLTGQPTTRISNLPTGHPPVPMPTSRPVASN